MAYAKGVNKVLAFGVEPSYGAPSVVAGQLLRRTSSTFTLNAPLIPSAEILSSQQMRDARQGPRSVSGTLSGQVSAGTYSALMAALLRGGFAAVPNSGSLADLLLNTTGGMLPPFTWNINSASSNFITNGIKAGDFVKFSLLPTPYTGDNGVPLQVQSIVSGGASLRVFGGLGSPVLSTFPASAQTGKVISAAKKLIAPSTGQLFPSFTFEEWYSDVGLSDLYLGCVPTQMQIQMPARGYATMSMSFLGQNMQPEANAQFFTGASPYTTTGSMMMVGGSVQYNGAQVTYFSSANLSVSSPVQADPMIGTNVAPAVFNGTLGCSGSFTALTSSTDTLTNDFMVENEVSLSFILAELNSPTANFISFWLPRVKLGAAAKQDSQTAISRSFTFQALEAVTTANCDDTTLAIYDSAA
ncbi:MAG: phage tail tube protein [Rhodospirillales bacterium]